MMATGVSREYNREANRRWNADRPAKRMMLDIRRRAKERGLPCTIDDLWIEVRLSDGCEMTGIPFDMRPGGPWPFGPSVDRKDPTKGYTEGNSRLVCWMYNLCKGRWTDEDVGRMCQARLEFERRAA